MHTDAAGTVVGRAPRDSELADSPTIRVGWVDEEDEIHWLTTSHLTPTHDIDDVIRGATGPYGSPGMIGRPPPVDEFI